MVLWLILFARSLPPCAQAYRLASDFYGIGFFSADKVALSIGLATDSNERIMAAIKHVLAASREFGHCYLTGAQTRTQVNELLEMDLGDRLPGLLKQMYHERSPRKHPSQHFFCPDAGQNNAAI